MQGSRRRACCTDTICSWPAGSLCGMSFICTCGGSAIGELLLSYRRDYSAACEGPNGTTRDGVCVRTGTAGSSLLLTLGWIVFTEVSSGRSGSGLAAGVLWCSGIILFAPAEED